jgi:hypothetical protein
MEGKDEEERERGSEREISWKRKKSLQWMDDHILR